MGRNLLLLIRSQFRVTGVKGAFSDHSGLAPSGVPGKGDGEAGRLCRARGCRSSGWPVGGQTRADSRLVLLTEVGCKDLTLVLEPSSGGSEATCLHMYC